jgi:hypothetical protein
MRVFCKRCNNNSAEMEGRGLPGQFQAEELTTKIKTCVFRDMDWMSDDVGRGGKLQVKKASTYPSHCMISDHFVNPMVSECYTLP